MRNFRSNCCGGSSIYGSGPEWNCDGFVAAGERLLVGCGARGRGGRDVGWTEEYCCLDRSPECCASVLNHVFIATIIGSWEAEYKDQSTVGISNSSQALNQIFFPTPPPSGARTPCPRFFHNSKPRRVRPIAADDCSRFGVLAWISGRRNRIPTRNQR